MAITITELCDRVVNRLFAGDPPMFVGADGLPARAEVDRIVIETVRAMDFDVDRKTGKIYNPAASAMPVDPHRRTSGPVPQRRGRR